MNFNNKVILGFVFLGDAFDFQEVNVKVNRWMVRETVFSYDLDETMLSNFFDADSFYF